MNAASASASGDTGVIWTGASSLVWAAGLARSSRLAQPLANSANNSAAHAPRSVRPDRGAALLGSVIGLGPCAVARVHATSLLAKIPREDARLAAQAHPSNHGLRRLHYRHGRGRAVIPLSPASGSRRAPRAGPAPRPRRP